jgi:hypothetical protein
MQWGCYQTYCRANDCWEIIDCQAEKRAHIIKNIAIKCKSDQKLCNCVIVDFLMHELHGSGETDSSSFDWCSAEADRCSGNSKSGVDICPGGGGQMLMRVGWMIRYSICIHAILRGKSTAVAVRLGSIRYSIVIIRGKQDNCRRENPKWRVNLSFDRKCKEQFTSSLVPCYTY